MQHNDDSIGKSRRIAGTILMGFGSLALIGSSVGKFAHVPKVVNEMTANGFGGELVIMLAVLELGSALLFLFPLTRAFGLQMVSAFLGGAIATHIQHGQSPVPPALVLSLFWIGAWLRHPIVLWSLRPERSGQAHAETAVRQHPVLKTI